MAHELALNQLIFGKMNDLKRSLRDEHFRQLSDLARNVPYLRKLPKSPVPAGYLKHDIIQASLDSQIARFLTQISQDPRFGPTSIFRSAIPSSFYALLKDAPLINVREDLTQAFLQTNPSDNESDYIAPYPCFLLNLPPDLVKTSFGFDFNFILVSSVPFMKEWWPVSGFPKIWEFGHIDAQYIATGFSSSGKYLPAPIALDPKSISLCAQRFNFLDQDPDFATIRRLVLNTILVINHAPELIEEQEVELSTGKGFGKKSVYKGSVRWLGRNYRRVTSTNLDRPGRPSRAKKPHWRKGHWHTVRYGAKRLLRKPQWFQPVYINGALKAKDNSRLNGIQ